MPGRTIVRGEQGRPAECVHLLSRPLWVECRYAPGAASGWSGAVDNSELAVTDARLREVLTRTTLKAAGQCSAVGRVVILRHGRSRGDVTVSRYRCVVVSTRSLRIMFTVFYPLYTISICAPRCSASLWPLLQSRFKRALGDSGDNPLFDLFARHRCVPIQLCSLDIVSAFCSMLQMFVPRISTFNILRPLCFFMSRFAHFPAL